MDYQEIIKKLLRKHLNKAIDRKDNKSTILVEYGDFYSSK